MPQKSASGAVKQVGGRKVAFSGKKKKDQLKVNSFAFRNKLFYLQPKFSLLSALITTVKG